MSLPAPRSSDRSGPTGADRPADDRPRVERAGDDSLRVERTGPSVESTGDDRPRVDRAGDDRPRVERLEVVQGATVARPQPRDPRSEAEVYRVTSAQRSLSEQQRFRTKRYLISMGIRTVCFLAAVFSQGWLRWAFLVGAVILPYVAVIMANAGRENDPFTGPEPVDDVDTRSLERGSDTGS